LDIRVWDQGHNLLEKKMVNNEKDRK